MHAHIAMNPNATDIENLNIMVKQQQLDREHMLVLKQAIESMHEAQEAQGQRLDEQANVNLRLFKDHAELQGTCTQHCIRIDTKSNEILASIRGKDMCDLVESITGDLIDVKVDPIGKELESTS